MRDTFEVFALELDGFSTTLDSERSLYVKKVAMEILRGVVWRTPVRTGRARGNWQVTLGSGPRGGTTGASKNVGVPMARGLSELARHKPGMDVWIHNNLPYIGALERGHSKQAPTGMLGVTLAGIRSALR